MARNQSKDQLGDIKMPALRSTERGLRFGSSQTEQINADLSQSASKPSVLGGLASAAQGERSRSTPPTTCKQTLWFSFFFDGTGNNLEADKGMLKHSNVAKLFRVHKKLDLIDGVYPLYIPGVGTYFAEIGDDGGSALGLGCGAMGQERLDYALKKFQKFLSPHLERAKAPSNAIVEINISVFGFSRGAALARAFVHLMLENLCSPRGGKWRLNNGAWPIRIRFIGLFDTVASVGLPLSTNTTSVAGAAVASVSYMIGSRLRKYPETRPEALAFSEKAVPGADPAPGRYDGHNDWGGKLKINDMVEEVRHFVAAHEIRNSFPLDSVSMLCSGKISKPVHFYESVYPGVHSDVGGSYAPGEGARAGLASKKLGLIPLRHMYTYALRAGVPMSPESAWADGIKDDFDVDPGLLSTYNHYLKKLGSSDSLGQAVNKNMELYFAWRFRAIRLKMKGDKVESDRISLQNARFKEQEVALHREIMVLKEKERLAETELKALLERRAAQASNVSRLSDTQQGTAILDPDIQSARDRHHVARDDLFKARARKGALPNMESLQAMLDVYDKQLLADVKAICDIFSKPGIFGGAPDAVRRAELRPHYKILVEAYENEFKKNKGLTDELIISFFDNYIHDSLAAFAKDATLPSDPRVVYLGGDEKYDYAELNGDDKLKPLESGIA